MTVVIRDIQFKRGLESNLPTLKPGEPAFTTDSFELWIGSDAGNKQIGGGSGSGDVTGPGSSTDHAVVRWDSTGGTDVLNSVVIIDDAGAVTGVTSFTMTGALSHQGGVAVFNEAGGDFDFRVESDASTHMVFVDAGTNRVGINQSAPQRELHVTSTAVTTLPSGLATNAVVVIENNTSTNLAFIAGTTGVAHILFYKDGGTTQEGHISYTYSTNKMVLNVGSTEILSLTNAITIFNDSAADIDIRAESTSNVFMFHLDAGNNTVNIGTSTSGTIASFGASIVFNEEGADRDFRIEGDTATSLLVTDAGLEAVQIGTTTAGVIADFRSTIIVFNETGADQDLRIEGDTATSLLVADAGLDAVQIGTTTAGVIADFRTAAIVFNEDGADRDFRVESDTLTNMLWVDAGSDRVVFNDTSTPSFSSPLLYARKDDNIVLLLRRDASTVVGLTQYYNGDTTDGNGLTLVSALGATTGAGATDTNFAQIRVDYTTHNHATRLAKLAFNVVDGGNPATRFAVDGNNAIFFATNGSYGGGKGVIFIADRTTAPAASNPVGGGLLYSSSGAGVWKGSSGTITAFGPAEPHCPRCGRDFAWDWENYERGYGKLSICAYCLTESLERVGVHFSEYGIEKRG